jgi:hypothetical protein
MDDSAIEAELEHTADEWSRVDPGVFRAVIQAEAVTFRLFVRRAGGWLKLEVSPLFDAPEDEAARAALHRDLLARNRTLFEGRFALGDDGEPILEAVVDERHGPAALRSAIHGLEAAMERHYPELRAQLGK